MFTFIVVLFTFVLYTQQQLKDPAFMEQWTKYKHECAKQEGADLDAITKAWNENRFPDDKTFKCYYKCMHLKQGVLDASGEVVDDALGKLAAEFNDAATKSEIVEECGPLKGADLCETAYKLMACTKAAQLD